MILAVCGMLFLAGGGAAVFVVTGVRWASMQKILQSGDYAPAEKSATKGGGTFRCLLDARHGCVSRLELHDRGLE